MAARLAACSVRRTSPRREHYSAEAKEPPAEAAWRGGWAPPAQPLSSLPRAAVIAGLSLSLMRTAGVFDILSAG
jgi:hypothetical protein